MTDSASRSSDDTPFNSGGFGGSLDAVGFSAKNATTIKGSDERAVIRNRIVNESWRTKLLIYCCVQAASLA